MSITSNFITRAPGIGLALTLAVAVGAVACDKNGDTTPPDPDKDNTAQVEEPAEPARVYPDPPPPGEQRPVNFPALQTIELPNKLTVYVVENHEVPIVDVQLVIKAGTVHDELLAEMTAGMLKEGTKKRSKEKIDGTIEQVGASLSSSAGTYNAVISTRVLTPDLSMAVNLVADVARNPKFEEDALDKLKEQKEKAIGGEKSDGTSLAKRLAGRLLYPKGHPYGADFPTEAEIKGLTIANIKGFYDTWYRPNNAYLILSGDVTTADVEKLLKKTLGPWKPAESFPAHPLESFSGEQYQAATPKEIAVHLVDRNQISADIVFANINGVPRNSPDYTKMVALNKLFGGGFSSRLFQDARETKKLTYNIGSFQSSQKVVGSFGIATQTKEVDQMMDLLFGHIDKLRAEEPTEEEFKATVDYLALSFPLQIETAAQIAGKVGTMLTFGLPNDYYNNYINDVRALTPADIKDMATKHVHEVPVIVIVGKAAKVERQLKDVKALEGAKVIKYDTDLKVIK